MAAPTDTWQAVQHAVATTTERFAALLANSDPAVMATADWSVADTAAHLAFIARWYRSLLRPESADFSRPPTHDTTVDTVADANRVTLAMFTERDVDVLRAALLSDVDSVLTACADTDPSALMPWLGGAKLPIASLLAHLVNELQLHGLDIAGATGLPWEIPQADAALFFELFLVGVAANEQGRLLESRRPPARRRIAVEFRSRYTTPVTMVAENGLASLGEPGCRADVVVTFEPAALNQMLFHRMGKLRAMASGKVLVHGPRPWLMPLFMRTVRLP